MVRNTKVQDELPLRNFAPRANNRRPSFPRIKDETMQSRSAETTAVIPVEPADATDARDDASRHDRKSADVTVVVPVHNAMPHLPACIDSILAQTVAAAEIICVDDGSTDASAAYLDGLEQEHPTISVVHQPCSGVSSARNRGLKCAHGSHILFVDADDLIACDLIEKALEAAQRFSSQMTIFGFDEYYAESDVCVAREICPDKELYDKAFSLADMSLPSPYLVTPNVWRILFDRAFLQESGLVFHEDLRTSEDLAFIYEALFLVKRIALIPDRLYRYRRDGGETLTRKTRGCAGIDALEHIRSFAAHHGVLERNMFHFCNIVLDVAEYATSTAYDLDDFGSIYRSFSDRLLGIVRKNEHLVHERYRPFYEHVQKGERPYLFFIYQREQHRVEDERTSAGEAWKQVHQAEQNLHEVERWARGRIDELERLLADSRQETQQALQEVADVRASRSYRLGNFFMRGPAAIKRALKGKSE